MHPHALGIGQCIAKLEESDVEVLRDQFLKEGLVRRQLSLAARRPLGRRFCMADGPHLMCPSCASGR